MAFDWYALLDGHWDLFAEAGWLESVTYTPYDPATDGPGAAVPSVDAVGEATSPKREAGAPDGGKAFEQTRRWHLRQSTMGGTPATKRGRITQADGTVWVVEDAEDVDGDEWSCDCTRY
jgi:hypothetical protein